MIPSLKPSIPTSYPRISSQFRLYWWAASAPLLSSKPIAYVHLSTHSLLLLPTCQLLLPISCSFNSCWLFTVSSSCCRCPQTWSVTSTKLNLANISGKPLISSGNRNNSVNLTLAKDPSAVGSSAARLASVLQQHPGFGWEYGLVMRFLTFFPASLNAIFKTQPGSFPLTTGFGSVFLYDSITSFYSIIVLLIFIFSLGLHLTALKELL